MVFPPVKKHLPLLIFITAYLLFVLVSFKSFGITWDEQAVYERGKLLYSNFYNQEIENRLTVKETEDDLWPSYNNTYAGVLYSLNKDQSFEVFHLINLLFGSLIFIFSYLIFYKKYKKPWLSIIAPLFLVLNPRFFGDLPANPKDMPFAIFYFLSIASIYLLTDIKKPWLRILILGFLFGFSQSIRSIGLTLYFILFFFDLYFWKIKLKKFNSSILLKFISREAIYILLIIAVSIIFNLITWPYLRSDVINHIKEILFISSKFPWNGEVLFMGKVYMGGQIPHSFLPVWLIIGVPLFILIFSLGSLFLFKKLKHNEIFFLSFTVITFNLILYFLINPVIYNGLRHYLFLLPFLSILAALFTIEMIKSKNKILKNFIFIFLILNIIIVILSQIKAFPYNYIYFNELTGGFKNASKSFETDYWAASSLEALRWLGENKKDRKYKIYTCGLPLVYINYFPENFSWVGNFQDSDFAICPTALDEYKIIPGMVYHTVGRYDIPFIQIIEVKKDI